MSTEMTIEAAMIELNRLKTTERMEIDRERLTAGFNECMRVLRPNGVLIFKWSEIQFPLSEILPLFSQKPLFGNRMIKRGNKTHWLAFMKAEVSE